MDNVDAFLNGDVYFGTHWNTGVGENDEFIDVPLMVERDLAESVVTNNPFESSNTNKILEANDISLMLDEALQEITPHTDFLQSDSPLLELLTASPQSNCQPSPNDFVQPCSPMVQQSVPVAQPTSPMVSPNLVQPSSIDLVQPSSPIPVMQSTSLIMEPSLSLTTLQPAAPYDLPPAATFSAQPALLESTMIPESQDPVKVEYMTIPSCSGGETIISIGTPSHTSIVSLEEPGVFSAAQVSDTAQNTPKKRGRKRKNEDVAPSRRKGPRKPKVYEMGEQDDEEQEKKRKNAVNAKRHRDMQKEHKVKLENDLTMITAERDHLLKEVKELREREKQLQERINSMSPIVISSIIQ